MFHYSRNGPNLCDGANELPWGPPRNVIGSIPFFEKDVHELVTVATIHLRNVGTVQRCWAPL